MKAIIWTKYGPPEVLKLKEIEKPTPKDNEILIKIHAANVTMGDCEMRNLQFSGLLKFLMKLGIGFKKPRRKNFILGQEFSGEVEDVGTRVTQFKRGDQVFAHAGFHFGGYAEYTCLSENNAISTKPNNITLEEAAGIPTGGFEAVHYLRKADLQEGQSILIRGASGSIGTIAIQLAKYYGAEVTAVGNPNSLEVMKSIGADYVIDYTKNDFTQNNKTYDVIFDVIGKSPFSYFRNSLKKKGVYLLANPRLKLFNREKIIAKLKGFKYISGNRDIIKEMLEQLKFLKELIEVGKLKIIIDKRYSLEQTPEAQKYVEQGNKTGNVMINVR